MLQVTFSEPLGAVSPPQQSLGFWHRSLVRRQPLAGWQMLMPDKAKGAQTRLQQPVHPAQTMPSCTQPPAPVVEMSLQTPAVAPVAIEQKPLQQSVDR